MGVAAGHPRLVFHLSSRRDVPASTLAFSGGDSTATHWLRGGVIGAVVGTGLAVLVLTQCDSDANSDCPGWGRAAAVLGVSTGAGILIGSMFHKR